MQSLTARCVGQVRLRCRSQSLVATYADNFLCYCLNTFLSKSSNMENIILFSERFSCLIFSMFLACSWTLYLAFFISHNSFLNLRFLTDHLHQTNTQFGQEFPVFAMDKFFNSTLHHRHLNHRCMDYHSLMFPNLSKIPNIFFY